MKQKNIKNQFICILLIICCTVTGLYIDKIKAGARDVTKSIPKHHNIRVVSEYFRTLCGYDLLELEEKMKIGQKKKYDFSKESTRRYALNRCFNELNSQIYAGIDVKTLSKQIFGKSTTKVSFIEGDWGLAGPKIKIKKIYKQTLGKYTVKADVDWVVKNDFNNEIADSYQIGEVEINFKKKPKSYYGYIVKSMILKKVSGLKG